MNKPATIDKPLITLEGVAFRRGDALFLQEIFWEIRTGQNWAILGVNGSGKSILARGLKGYIPHVQGRLIRHSPEAAGEKIGYLSFELQEEILNREDRFEDARSFGGGGHALTAGELLGIEPEDEGALKGFNGILDIHPLLGRSIRVLSNGEIRKVLITRALLAAPKLLILDEPFAGLDVGSREALARAIQALMGKGIQIILITQRAEEIFSGITHLLVLQDGRAVQAGKREQIPAPDLMKPVSGIKTNTPPPFAGLIIPKGPEKTIPADLLVEMRNVRVAYGGTTVLDRLTWNVRRGENWAVIGPNGSGKTTLLSLITGENLQAYANDVRIFGRKRGDGESIWDIRKRIGLVSPELQLRFRKPIPVRDVVLSGFFDSVGLYHNVSALQVEAARQWLACIAMERHERKLFNQLSYGEKRLVLLARAMVKYPELLILDEPCQGLDRSNREMVLGLMEEIGTQTSTGMIYVTHHKAELIPCIKHVLKLDREVGRDGVLLKAK